MPASNKEATPAEATAVQANKREGDNGGADSAGGHGMCYIFPLDWLFRPCVSSLHILLIHTHDHQLTTGATDADAVATIEGTSHSNSARPKRAAAGLGNTAPPDMVDMEHSGDMQHNADVGRNRLAEGENASDESNAVGDKGNEPHGRKQHKSVSKRRVYTIESLRAVRRANDWTHDAESYQVAVKWRGYPDPTWERLETLSNDRFILHTILKHITAPEGATEGALITCDAQPADEAEGTVARLDF